MILVRGGGRHTAAGLEALLVQRSPSARFMPGVWVFPGGTVTGGDGDDAETAHRGAALRELAEETGIELPADLLRPLSRWITPAQLPVRFDTRFYIARAPAHASPEPDNDEVVACAWLAPRTALARHEQGELPLIFPTIKHLELLAGFTTADEAIAGAPPARIEPVEPRVIQAGGDSRIVLPGEPGYDSDE